MQRYWIRDIGDVSISLRSFGQLSQKYHRLSGLNNTHLCRAGLVAGRRRSGCQRRSVLGEGHLPGRQMAICRCVFTGQNTEGWSELYHVPFYEGTNPAPEGSTLVS